MIVNLKWSEDFACAMNKAKAEVETLNETLLGKFKEAFFDGVEEVGIAHVNEQRRS